jgi:hypothetical protein
MGNTIHRISNYVLYRLNPSWRFNISSSDNSEKLRRWFEFISEADRRSVEHIKRSLSDLISENPWYEISLIAHGSSTFGKTEYRDIDLILEPSNGRREMYDKLWDKLRKDFKTKFEGGFDLNRNWILEFNLAYLYPNGQGAKPLQVGYRTNIFAEEYAEPLKGNDLIQLMRKSGNPCVPIILDNKPVKC